MIRTGRIESHASGKQTDPSSLILVWHAYIERVALLVCYRQAVDRGNR